MNQPGEVVHVDWPEVLQTLTSREDLSPEVAGAAMTELLQGGVPHSVVAAFLAALRTKGETISEMSSFAKTMRLFGREVRYEGPVIDTCGTGGDRRHTINVSTTAALIVAGAGGTVCKHGGRAASSMSGSADVLETLGVTVELGPEAVARCMDLAGIGFCFAPTYHPAMASVVPVRRELRIPTLFNFLGPLVNPAHAQFQIVGVSDPSMAEILIGVLQELGSRHSLVVCGEDGLDELSTTAPSRVVELIVDDAGEAEIRRFSLDPGALGFRAAELSELRGGDAAFNARILVETLEGKEGARSDISILNAAGGLYAGGLAASFEEGVEVAREAVANGAALEALSKMIDASSTFSP